MEKLSLAHTGIGSLPFSGANAPNDAVNYVFECCPDFPYWPQLPHFKKEEDMSLQFSQNLLGLEYDEKECKYYFNDTTEEFFTGLETLFIDYETVTASSDLFENEDILNKYKISKPYSNTIDIFLETLKNKKPGFVKGSVTGAFTLSTNFCDTTGKAAYYNETLREVIVKTLSLKALWQIKEFKKFSPASVPVIFIDEPSISQVGSCAFLTVKKEDVSAIIRAISSDIKKFGALSGIHCCGNTDWSIAIEGGVDIINFDAFLYAESVGIHSNKLKTFMENGGFLSFGIIPTLDKDALNTLDVTLAHKKFISALNCLTSKGLDKDFILKHSFITPSCGCGSLDETLAKKALGLLKDLSELLKSQNKVIQGVK